MNDPSPEMTLDPAVLNLLAGVLCGAVPFVLGLKRKRTDIGLGGLVACLVASALGGLVYAVPAAAVLTVIIMVVAKPRSLDDTANSAAERPWRDWTPDGDATEQGDRFLQDRRPTTLNNPGPTPAARDSAATFSCPSCGTSFLPDGDRIPPWCKKCGHDLKFTPKAPPAPEPAPQLATAVAADAPADSPPVHLPE